MANEPFATWMVFSTVHPGRYLTIDNDKFNRDWQTFVSHEMKGVQILELLGLREEVVLTTDRYAVPAFFISAREHDLDSIATRYAITQAQGDAENIRRRVEEAEKQREWETVVQNIRAAMDSPGTPASGMQFETAFMRVLKMAGCDPREVRTVGEQIDASCWISNLPILIEMLNSTKPADAPEVRDLAGKLQMRPASVIGVLCAPNGFTAGATEVAEKLSTTRAILLWKRADIEEILKAPDRISSFLMERYRAFIDAAGAQGGRD